MGTQIIGTGSFIAKVSKDLQSVFVAEVYRGLGVLLSILKVWRSWRVSKKLYFKLVSDCDSALYQFNTNFRQVTMTAKLSNIVRELLLVKKECISRISIEKVDAHQNNRKS